MQIFSWNKSIYFIPFLCTSKVVRFTTRIKENVLHNQKNNKCGLNNYSPTFKIYYIIYNRLNVESPRNDSDQPKIQNTMSAMQSFYSAEIKPFVVF